MKKNPSALTILLLLAGTSALGLESPTMMVQGAVQSFSQTAVTLMFKNGKTLKVPKSLVGEKQALREGQMVFVALTKEQINVISTKKKTLQR